MFKREMKINLRNFIIWTSIIIAIFLVVFLVYPYIIKGENIQQLNEMIAIFPEEILKAFNMDISSIDSAFGWLKTEGFTFILLITGIYSGILGSNILVKEESDKTIEYLNSVPVTRTKIAIDKTLCGIIYIILMVVTVGMFNYIGLSFSGDFDRKSYILLSITPILSSLVIFTLCLFISTFTHKTKKTLGISLGIVFLNYFFNVISELSKETEVFKYISAFTLADTRNVIIDIKINPILIIITCILSIIFVLFTLIRYNKKELV